MTRDLILKNYKNVRLKTTHFIILVLYLIRNWAQNSGDSDDFQFAKRRILISCNIVPFASSIKMQKVIAHIPILFSIFIPKGISSPRILLAHSWKVIVFLVDEYIYLSNTTLTRLSHRYNCIPYEFFVKYFLKNSRDQ